MSKDLAIYEYQPQGAGHIIKLCCLTAAGFGLVSLGGSILFGIPLGAAMVYSMFRGTGKAKEPAWIQARDEIWDYKLSPKHKSLKDEYKGWCDEWGKSTINSLIEPMIGNCHLANFVKDKKHPYHGLRAVIVYDHQEDDLPPLTPHDYVKARLQQRLEALSRNLETIDVNAQTIPLEALPSGDVADDPQKAYQFLLNLTQAPLQPVIIAGLPGSGKGALAAIALSLGVRDNGLKYWVFNVKAKLDEAGYWVRSERHYLKDRLQSDNSLFDDLMSVLEAFATEGSRRNSQPGEHQPFVLLLEEINALTGLLTTKQRQQFKAKIVALASLLRGCNMALWLSGQSITLEDLGLTGKSNRAMFTAIVAVGPNREGIDAICQPLQIPFNESKLKTNERYWLTSNQAYTALPMPSNLPQFSDWKEVNNLIDLRPGATVRDDIEASVIELDELLMGEQASPVVEAKPSIDIDKSSDDGLLPLEHLENSYRLSAPDEFPIEQNSSELMSEPETPTDDLLRYLKERNGQLPVSALKNWGRNRRKGSLSAEDTDQILIELINAKVIETFNPNGTKAEWIRVIATE